MHHVSDHVLTFHPMLTAHLAHLLSRIGCPRSVKERLFSSTNSGLESARIILSIENVLVTGV
jgi:hypothetical protein